LAVRRAAVRQSAVHQSVAWSWLRRQPAVCRVTDRFVAMERQSAVQPAWACLVAMAWALPSARPACGLPVADRPFAAQADWSAGPRSKARQVSV
jgi:hypothetical protein